MEITHILQHLFNKDSLEDIPVGTLEEMTTQYPYFATGHFLLSKKLKQTGSESFKSTLQKTNLYFNDTLWLHYLLEDDHGHPGEAGSAINITDLPSSAAVTTAVPTVAVSAADTVAAASEAIQESGPAADPASEKPAPSSAEEISGNESGPFSTDQPAVSPVLLLPDNGHAETEADMKPTPVREAEQENYVTDRRQETVTATGEQASTAETPLNTTGNTGQEEVVTSTQQPAAEIQDPAGGQPANRGVIPVEKEQALTFDPYHTIDYFASLGIRLSNEIKPDDKLGNQLKSFTQWLKTMKKLPSGAVENTGRMEPFESARIEKIAAHSLEEKEIITEAMAEVLVKQGKTEKAKAVYHKLSLLNPGKIAYFAAKIDELK